MVKSYIFGGQDFILKSDLACEFPIYIYLSDDKKLLLYSESIKELLDDVRVDKPLELGPNVISFLLQSGVVPLPNTVYKNIFIVGIGYSVVIRSVDNEIEIKFSHKFPFLNECRGEQTGIDEQLILELLSGAVISRIDDKKQTFLFHSAGKDSNSIALALAEAGWQDRITCVSHKSKGDKDESEISKKIATKLGFSHQKVFELSKITQSHLNSFGDYFENIPLPCMDNVVLAYPIYSTQINFHGSNIIDGSGNDVYMGHIPSKSEYFRQKYFSKFDSFRFVADRLTSGSVIRMATNTRAEWAGLFGFSYGDVEKFSMEASDVHSYWRDETENRKDWDYFDLRADIWGGLVEFEKVMRKVRNFADMNSANVIFPFTNEDVTKYIFSFSEECLFNRRELRNKLPLRKLLHEKIDINSDSLGKMAYEFDYYSILMMMRNDVDHEILSCKLWRKDEVKRILDSLYAKIDLNHRLSGKIKAFVQRVYLISAWHNRNKYLKK